MDEENVWELKILENGDDVNIFITLENGNGPAPPDCRAGSTIPIAIKSLRAEFNKRYRALRHASTVGCQDVDAQRDMYKDASEFLKVCLSGYEN